LDFNHACTARVGVNLDKLPLCDAEDFPGTDKLRKKYVVPALAGCIKTNFRDVKYAFVRIV
jgi:hypothetical protein